MFDPNDLYQAILTGDAEVALAKAQAALAEAVEPTEIIQRAIAPAMREAGNQFEEGEYFVPELLMAARATKGVFELLRPLLAQKGVEPIGRVILGTVEGDLHDIGKNLVAAMLEGGGFEVIDLGVSVKPDQFLRAQKERQADIVGISALLTTTMPAMRATLDAFKAAELRDSVKVMVGGAPVTEAFANAIGADGYAENASMAVQMARQLLGK